MRNILLVVLFFFHCQLLWAQTKSKVEIVFAQNFEGIKTYSGQLNKLIGQVQLKQNNTFMWCDSALLFDNENRVEAYGNVRINHNDSVNITGDYLNYNGNERQAFIKGNVVLTDKSIVLTTDQLDYNLNSGEAFFMNGGIIKSDLNTLTSVRGYYYTRVKQFYFNRNVVLTNPDYQMLCDTLLYQTMSKTAFFFGPTNIVGKSEKIYCENGWYDTNKDISQFSRNAKLLSDGKILSADSLFYNRKAKLGKAFKNISLYDSAQKIWIYGDYGQTNDITRVSFVTLNAYALKLMNKKDTLQMAADTFLLNQKLRKQSEKVIAFRNVKLFKTDLQAICDSLVYESSDSTLTFYKSPVLWNGINQITADTMKFYMVNNSLDSFVFLNNAFVVSQEKGQHFNQVRGRDMNGRFDSSNIKQIYVLGNGQSIYYAKEDSVNYAGINVIDCSEMVFYLNKGKIEKAVFVKNADATLYPLDEQKPENLRLKGFKWLANVRPKKLIREN